DSTGQSENENFSKVKDKKIKSRKRTLQDEDNDSTEQSKNKNIKSRKRTLYIQDESSDSTEQSENENAFKLKYKNCSDATYLAEQIKSKEQLCDADAVQLYNIRVQLRHMVLPQHEIETRAGSHMPMRKEIEEFESITPLRKGPYSSDEDEIIVHNWKVFCKLHNWDKTKVKPFLRLRIGNETYMRNTKERRKFVQFLADGLPDRTLYSVYHRFKNLYENNLQRRYRPEEDLMIIDHLEHNPSLDQRCKYSALAKVLRRTRNSIWRRYKILKKKRNKNSIEEKD
ncbi:PREDICTED: uncharacterized protein LOC105560007, partial [Vollenhovia emeryi]|uniref:uncharacterized protein LOC105560007 n=1 Tax=Vollenhovia emeryi TaxID=411798 RepID=UPI0005F38C32